MISVDANIIDYIWEVLSFNLPPLSSEGVEEVLLDSLEISLMVEEMSCCKFLCKTGAALYIVGGAEILVFFCKVKEIVDGCCC